MNNSVALVGPSLTENTLYYDMYVHYTIKDTEALESDRAEILSRFHNKPGLNLPRLSFFPYKQSGYIPFRPL
jgi:hypothetical protein